VQINLCEDAVYFATFNERGRICKRTRL